MRTLLLRRVKQDSKFQKNIHRGNYPQGSRHQGPRDAIGQPTLFFYPQMSQWHHPHPSVSLPTTLPYFECLCHLLDGRFNFVQEASVDNLVKMRNGGRSGKRPSSRLATCLDLAITLTGSSLGLEQTSLSLTLKTGNRKV